MRAPRLVLAGSLALLLAVPLEAQTPGRRPLRVSDIYQLREVRGPQLSPDGGWVAYTVTKADSAKDKNNTDVWMTSWDGSQTVQLTFTPESENTPRWSPDGRYLAFLSSREGSEGAQVWLLNRLGGEAVKLTDLKGGVDDFAWSPDGKRLALIVTDADTAAVDADSATADPDSAMASGDSATSKAPKPIVIDRYRWMSDSGRYLGNRREHLWTFDVESRKAEQILFGAFDESSPAWSPDGRLIAFVSNRSAPDPDRANNADVWVVEPRPGATPRQVTTWPGPDTGPLAWSPDGRLIAYLQGSEPEFSAYDLDRLAVAPAAGGPARLLTDQLDRPVSDPVWSSDGRSILFTIADDRSQYVARVPAAGGAVEKIAQGQHVIWSLHQAKNGRLVALMTDPAHPAEVYAVEKARLRQLTHQNDEWLAQVALPQVDEITAQSTDNTTVNGVVWKPADFQPGTRYPTLLRIHGGPNGQDAFEFDFENLLLASHGYLVLAPNYRGSSGRGGEFQRAIYADWGNKEVDDLLATVGRAVEMGMADPARLGIGGWSYGGILTNYTIARDNRFKAAISGAGSSLQLSIYGNDQYIFQEESELPPPWKDAEPWIRMSYPFFEAERITTPTLFLTGEDDFNVPRIGSFQMYQALRSLGVPTQLIIYPGERHGISRPSFKRDRLERYLDWYAKYIPGASGTAAASR